MCAVVPSFRNTLGAGATGTTRRLPAPVHYTSLLNKCSVSLVRVLPALFCDPDES